MDAGGVPVFPNAGNPGNHLNNLHLQQQHQQQQQLVQQHGGLGGGGGSIDPNPKRQAVVERLKRRFETYRRRNNDVAPRFEQTFSSVVEQQSIETSALQKRFLESKAKRQAKKPEKKQPEPSTLAGNLQSSVHVVSRHVFGYLVWCFVRVFVIANLGIVWQIQ